MLQQKHNKPEITIGTHFFYIKHFTERQLSLILHFCKKYIIYDFSTRDNTTVNKGTKVFATRTRDLSEYRFHIGQYKPLMEFFEHNFVYPTDFVINKLPKYIPQAIECELNPSFVLRDYQIECRDFLTEDIDEDLYTRLVSLDTGLGKTLIASSAISYIKQRTALVILPTFIDKWIGDIKKNLMAKDKDIMVVQGSNQLKSLIQLGLTDQLKQKYIIISLVTYINYIKAFEEDPELCEDEYGCVPERFFEVIKVGVLPIDETHIHIHSIYKMLCYTQGPKVIGMTGTLVSDNPTISEIHKVIFPKEIRYDKIKMKKYIKVIAISYSFLNFFKANIRTTPRGKKTYSHVQFEKSLLRNKTLLNNYFKLIDSVFEFTYTSDYMKNDKCAILFSTIEMCDKAMEYFTNKYSKNYSIKRYVDNDPYENAMSPDLRISTIQSFGTALDVPNLRVMINTVNTQSPVSNLQSLGRLREINDRDVKYSYIYCEDIAKHREYHSKRCDMFASKAASIKDLCSNMSI